MWVRAAHKLGVFGGSAVMLAGAGGFAAIAMAWPVWRLSTTQRLEAIFTTLITLAFLSYGCAVVSLSLGRKRGWSARRCYYVGILPLVIIGSVWAWLRLFHNAEFAAGMLLVFTGTVTGQMARKLAYPASKFSDPLTEAPVHLSISEG
jgi:hypothetical protein